MKLPAPTVLRKGAVVRVPVGDPLAAQSSAAYAVTYADLQFCDGHVERWFGSGWLHPAALDEHDRLESLMDWGRDAFDDQQYSLLGELGREFAGDPHDHLAEAPVEIVIEWNAEVPSQP